MSMSTINQGYLSQIADLPDEAFLGQLLFFSISAADVNYERAKQDLIALGLPLDQLRGNLRPIDAFRKATNDMGRKFKPVDGIRSEVLVRSLGEDAEQSYVQLILERVQMAEGKRRKVFYERIADVTFTRGVKGRDGTYTGHGIEAVDVATQLGLPLDPLERDWLDTCLRTYKARYEHYLTHLDSHAVRSYVRETVYQDLDGVCVKGSGGLYFVQQANATLVEALSTWVKSIGSQFHHLPLLNIAEQRDMIMEAFDSETADEANSLMSEIGKILQEGRPILEKTYDAYMEKAVRLATRSKKYSQTMGGRAANADQQVALLHAQAMQLANNIRTKQV